MKQRVKRPKSKLRERLLPCQFCDYPISEKHHALPISIFGKTPYTLQLCANCHELYHIVERVILYESKRAAYLLNAFKNRYGDDDARLLKAYHFIAAALRIFKGDYGNE